MLRESGGGSARSRVGGVVAQRRCAGLGTRRRRGVGRGPWARGREGGGLRLRCWAARGRPPPAVASLRPGLAGQARGLGAVAAPGGAAAGLMLCDRGAPPDNWLPPAEKGCGLVSPRRRVRGGVRPGGVRTWRLCAGHRGGPRRVPGAGLQGRGPEGVLPCARGLSGSSEGLLIVCRSEQLSPCDGVAPGLSPRGSDWGYL